MAKSGVVARHLRTLLEVGTAGVLSDEQLLERFSTRHGEVAEAAFAALVERHGPMVLGVCRRTLADPRDAEDAFQATFLVLVRKARTVRVDDSLGRWLYGVACRVAARARARSARRRIKEGETLLDRAGLSLDDAEQLDLRRVLDEELARLPEKYRAPLVLCYLEGLTHEMAAERLGWPLGTVRGRLSRARDRLRARLASRGLAPAAGIWTGSPLTWGVSDALAEKTAQAALQYATTRAVTGGTATAVAVLTEGTLKTMALSKLKLSAAALLAMAATSVVAPVFLAAAGQAPVVAQPTRPADRPESAARQEAIRAAAEAFGPEHWSADPTLAVRYSDPQHGYRMFAKAYERLKEGRQLRFRPFALVWKSPGGKVLKTVTGDEAVVDLDGPLDLTGPSGPAPKVIHARVEGKVQLRDGKGTPEPGDDLVIGPLPYVEFDEPSRQIRSQSDVVIRDRVLKIKGFDLLVQLRPRDENGPAGGLDARSVSLRKNAQIVVDDVGRSGLLPGKAGPAPDPAAGDARIPLDLRCAGELRIELDGREPGVRVGPPASSSSALIRLSRDVVVRRGRPGQTPDQLDCDELRLTLRSALRSGADADSALQEMTATGHAVWFQLVDPGITVRCNELQLKKGDPERGKETVLRGSGPSRIWMKTVGVVPAAEDPNREKPPTVVTLRASEAILVDVDGERGGDDLTVMLSGAVSFESRQTRSGPVEGKAFWQGRLMLQTERNTLDGVTRGYTLIGRPESSGPVREQVGLAADKVIVWPKSARDPATSR